MQISPDDWPPQIRAVDRPLVTTICEAVQHLGTAGNYDLGELLAVIDTAVRMTRAQVAYIARAGR